MASQRTAAEIHIVREFRRRSEVAVACERIEEAINIGIAHQLENEIANCRFAGIIGETGQLSIAAHSRLVRRIDACRT